MATLTTSPNPSSLSSPTPMSSAAASHNLGQPSSASPHNSKLSPPPLNATVSHSSSHASPIVSPNTDNPSSTLPHNSSANPPPLAVAISHSSSDMSPTVSPNADNPSLVSPHNSSPNLPPSTVSVSHSSNDMHSASSNPSSQPAAAPQQILRRSAHPLPLTIKLSTVAPTLDDLTTNTESSSEESEGESEEGVQDEYSKTYRLVDYSSQLTGSPSASIDSDFRGERRCSRVEKAAPQHVRLSLNAEHSTKVENAKR
nr:hypothetical protein Iba_chr07aCG6050 [Ipomoea batatas]